MTTFYTYLGRTPILLTGWVFFLLLPLASPAISQSANCEASLQPVENRLTNAQAALRICKDNEQVRLRGAPLLEGRTAASACNSFSPLFDACWAVANQACDAIGRRDTIRETCRQNDENNALDTASSATETLNDARLDGGANALSKELTERALTLFDENGRMALDSVDSAFQAFDSASDLQNGTASTNEGIVTPPYFESSTDSVLQDLTNDISALDETLSPELTTELLRQALDSGFEQTRNDAMQELLTQQVKRDGEDTQPRMRRELRALEETALKPFTKEAHPPTDKDISTTRVSTSTLRKLGSGCTEFFLYYSRKSFRNRCGRNVLVFSSQNIGDGRQDYVNAVGGLDVGYAVADNGWLRSTYGYCISGEKTCEALAACLSNQGTRNRSLKKCF